jgi:hypothetical protein
MAPGLSKSACRCAHEAVWIKREPLQLGPAGRGKLSRRSIWCFLKSINASDFHPLPLLPVCACASSCCRACSLLTCLRNLSNSSLPSGPTRCSSLSIISSGVSARSNLSAWLTSQRITFESATPNVPSIDMNDVLLVDAGRPVLLEGRQCVPSDGRLNPFDAFRPSLF